MAFLGTWKLVFLSVLFTNVARAQNRASNPSAHSRGTSEATASSDGRIPKPSGQWVSPEYPAEHFFQHPLPKPPLKKPKYTYYPEESAHADIEFYEVELKTFQKQIYPNLPATELTGYDGESPGPMFVMEQGREAVVRFTNNGPYNMSVHVHGQYNRAPFDGWAGDYAGPGQYKDYYYPNAQNARTAWYHDHTEFTTGEHAYRGQEGSYVITDPEEQALNLPKGDHDVLLAIGAKMFNEDGSLRWDTNNSIGLWGDVITVNGQPWPYLKVEPRKYRFRLLNGAVSRSFHLSFAEDKVVDDEYVVGNSKDVTFDVIGADAGLLSYPVSTDNIALTMGERYEIVVDFCDFSGKNITLKNDKGIGENLDYAATDMIMRFIVDDWVTDYSNNGDLPSTLRYIPPPPTTDIPDDKNFTFEYIDGGWKINGVGFTDIENRILAKPSRGGDEIWTLTNGKGGGTHPIHIHLVDFNIISRTGGRNEVMPYEAAAMKDVVWMAAGETIRVVARYAPWDGIYMFHCHNLIHEDNDMMAVFNVTNLEKWGYDETTNFINPLEEEFRPKNVNDDRYTEDAIMDKIDWFYGKNPYNHGNVEEVIEALNGAS